MTRLLFLGFAFSIAAFSFASQPNKIEQDKRAGKTGSRLVGISCICQPPYSSIKDTEKWIGTAALDNPDLILLTEGCMCNTPWSSSREERDAKSDLLKDIFIPEKIQQKRSRKNEPQR